MTRKRIGTTGAQGESPENEEGLYYRLFEFAPDAILVVNGDGVIAQANAKTEESFGYGRREIVGRSVEVLIPERFSSRHVNYRTDYCRDAKARPMGAGLELVGRRKDGSEFPVDIMLSPVRDQTVDLVVAVVRDVTDRKKAEMLAQEVERSAVLLKEVHHRVKNNLQIISSLLYLQSTQDSNPAVARVLKECQARIASIGLIHERLYRSPVHERLDFADYLKELLAELVRSYGVPVSRIQVHTDFEEVHLGIDTVIPCALIAHEFISNVFSHAFPNNIEGQVWIELRALDGGRYSLTVRDTGTGMPSGFDVQRSESLGLRLVRDLTTQLNGQFDMSSTMGTCVRITFAELGPSERGGEANHARQDDPRR